jgi:putative membrane protein
MRQFLIAAAGAAALVGGCAAPMAEDMGTAAAVPEEVAGMPTRAPAYMAMAASSDMFEIESSRLALQMSRNPAVRQFAQMLINDHSRMSSEMMGVAQSAGLPPPPMQMMPRHAEMMQRLSASTPTDFDMNYRREQIMAHQEAVTMHRTFADRGDLPALRALAARAAPVVEMHLAEAQRLPDQPAPMAAPAYTPPAYTPPPAVDTRRRGERG